MRLARADRERHHRAIDGTILAASEYVNVVATSQSHYGVAAARAWSRAGARGCAFHAGSRPLGVMWSGATLLLPAAAMRLGRSSSSVVLHGRVARAERPVLAARARSPTGLAGGAVARDEGLRGCRRASRTRVGRAGCGCASRSGRPLLRLW